MNKEVTKSNFKNYFRDVFNEIEKYSEVQKVRNIQTILRSLPSREKLVLLAAGRGRMMMKTADETIKSTNVDPNLKERARDVVKKLQSKSKCLLVLPDEKTIIQREIDQFIEAGFHWSDIIVVGGYNSHALIEAADELKVDYVHNNEWDDQEILGALISALKQRRG